MKVLIVRLSSFGDQIHACPAISDLKRQRPDIEIHWLVQTEFAAVACAHQSVSKVLTVPFSEIKRSPSKIKFWLELVRVVSRLKDERYDVIVDIQGVIKSAMMAFLTGGKVRIGFGKAGLAEPVAYWFYHRHFIYQPGMTSVTKLRFFIQWAFNLESFANEPNFGLTKDTDSKIEREPGILFVPFASQISKMLPLESWGFLAKTIRNYYPDLKITLSWGSEDEFAAAKQIACEVNGIISPSEHRFERDKLVNSIASYQLVVGLDTGITPLANALGVPTVMIFKKSAPQLFYTAGSKNSHYLGSANIAPTQAELDKAILKLLRRILILSNDAKCSLPSA